MFSNMSRQQETDDVPWMLRYGARGAGCFGGIAAIVLGVVACITLTPMCLVTGIVQMVSGFVILVFEAPCCCLFLDNVQKASSWADMRPYWQKAVLYLIMATPSIVLCWSFATFFGGAIIFGIAVLYGLMAMGKKASRDEMIRTAGTPPSMAYSSEPMKATLVDNMELPEKSPTPFNTNPFPPPPQTFNPNAIP